MTDVDLILSRRHDNGADYWATPDGKIYVGSPFSTLHALGMLHELGVGPEHEGVAGGLDLILGACRPDGRIRVGPHSPLHPCYAAEAARILCRFGLAGHEALQRTIAYFLGASHPAGGWRCTYSGFGRGPETDYANPGATLYVLDVLRYYADCVSGEPVADRAVASLLDHWTIRKPLGPCHFGIGTRFMQVEYPFFRYNLFFYVYVLSFYGRARDDERFRSALGVLQSKLDDRAEVVVERTHRGLGGLRFCARARSSARATGRYREIVDNLGRTRGR